MVVLDCMLIDYDYANLAKKNHVHTDITAFKYQNSN